METYYSKNKERVLELLHKKRALKKKPKPFKGFRIPFNVVEETYILVF